MLVCVKFCLSGWSSAETVALFETSVDISESSTVAVCHSSVTAAVCEICDFIKFYAVLELFEANSGLLQNIYWL